MRETSCNIHWIEIYPVDNAIHLLKPGLRVVPYCLARKSTVIKMIERGKIALPITK